MRLRIGSYANDPTFAGWVETDNWIIFVRHDGGHDYFGSREPSGAVR